MQVHPIASGTAGLMEAPTKGSLWFMVSATARLDSGITGGEAFGFGAEAAGVDA